jgi:hypothetical protein
VKPVRLPEHQGAESDDRYIITSRADSTAWFKLYRLQRFPELKWKYGFFRFAAEQTAFDINPTGKTGNLHRMHHNSIARTGSLRALAGLPRNTGGNELRPVLSRLIRHERKNCVLSPELKPALESLDENP